MVVYRIARQKWIDTLTGSGVAGRWNKTGYRMIYTSSSLALALLEILVHVRRDQLPDYWFNSGEIPDELVADSTLESVPSDSQLRGSVWLESRPGAVALSVPSVIVPERN